jgi:hypothetical protein
MLFNNTGETIEIIGCSKAKSLAPQTLAELGICEDHIIINLSSGASYTYTDFALPVIDNWGAFEPYMEFKAFRFLSILKVQVNEDGLAFVTTKNAVLPMSAIPNQPEGFPLKTGVLE